MNISSLLFLIFFIYAVLGVFLFKGVGDGIIIDEFTNFRNFGAALIALLRVSTGEDWNLIMYDCMDEAQSGLVVTVFFVSFIVICSFVMLNLFILVILQQFDEYYLPEDNNLVKFKRDLEKFKKVWSVFAKDFKNVKVKDSVLVHFFSSMEPRLGMKGMDSQNIIKNIVRMDLISDEEGFVYFNDLLYVSMKRLYGDERVLNKSVAKAEIKTA